MGASAIISAAITVLQNAPALVSGVQEAIAAGKQLWDIATNDTPPTDDQLAQYDAALQAAHKALQAS